jgi:hypothetical protein
MCNLFTQRLKMNERIKQLKQQATNYVDSVDDGLGIEHYRELVDLKFAELIIRECCDVLHDNEMGGYQVNYVLKEHFGVEE